MFKGGDVVVRLMLVFACSIQNSRSNLPSLAMNYFPKGTKLFSIIHTDPSVAIAAKVGENEYVKAVIFSKP